MLASRTGLTRLAWTCTTRLTRARTLSLQSSDSVLFEAENATLYPFGTPTSDPRAAIVTDLSWTLSTNQAWAVIGSFGSTLVDATLLGRARPESTGNVRWPFIEARCGEIERSIRKVAFRTRLEARSSLGATGGFVDYSSRYGGLRSSDEDAVTLRAHLADHIEREGLEVSHSSIEEVAAMLDVTHLLDMPLIVLSNGQTRRARIARALLSQPEVLVLEEPFTGLDVAHRASLSNLLGRLHARNSPHTVMMLRPQDELPEWITHTIDTSTSGGIDYLGPKSGWSPSHIAEKPTPTSASSQRARGKVLANFRNVSISGRRPVLEDITWQIREGDRWQLKGHNGSGKTTLLAVLLGDHPQSWSLAESVQLFGKSRDGWATADLQARIGHASPEINNSFPRRGGLSAREAIGTGFENVFVYRRLTSEQDAAIDDLAVKLGRDSTWLDRSFIELSSGDQALALLMRALVKRPPLVVLDEPMAGMDDATIVRVHDYLEHGLDDKQALVLVTHYETEIPASVDRVLELSEGSVLSCTE